MDEYQSRQEQHRINDADFADGWRYSFGEAIDAALAGRRDGDEAQIAEHLVRKRGDSSFHDHKIKLSS
jgi:hypothetical protein